MERHNGDDLAPLLAEVHGCTRCELPLGPRPVLQIAPRARILIAGQAPGRRVHESGILFDDPSGDRLRDWLGVDHETFYDPGKITILPMAFCFPGTGRSGDLPPPPLCAVTWRAWLLAHLEGVQLTIIIGKYARDWHLPERAGQSLTETIADWRALWPDVLPAPHPSPRNNRWLARNPWFRDDLLPLLKSRVGEILST